MDRIFFDSWQSIVRTSIITIVAYVGLVLFVRAAGKRSLAKMNAFDFIVTVALGSTLATVALSKKVPLADGLSVFALLLGLQATITWVSVRSKMFRNLITSRPAMLVYQGEIIHATMKKERITEEELWAAARKSGIGNTADIAVAVLETTGDITVIGSLDFAKAQTVQNVSRKQS